MPNDFQQGFQSGSAVFAPFIAATQQGQALQVAQQQEQARRMFQAQQLQAELDARSKLARADQLFRAKQAEAQLAAAAAEAEKSRMFTAQRDETRFDNEFAILDETESRRLAREQEATKDATATAAALFGLTTRVNDQITQAVQITSADQEKALATALTATGVEARRTPGETTEGYLNRVAAKNPGLFEAYQASLSEIALAKQQSPKVQVLVDQSRRYGEAFQSVIRNNTIDPSFLNDQANIFAPQGQGGVDDISQALDKSPPGGGAPQPPALPDGMLAPSSGGAAQLLGNIFSPLITNAPPRLPDVSKLLFGSPGVADSDIPSLEAFAVQSGIDAKQFQDLVNNAPTDSDAQKALRDLKQRKLQSDAMQNRPTQRNLLGTDLKIPTETGPMFR